MKCALSVLSSLLIFTSIHAEPITQPISLEKMQAIYNEVKTPYKYGIVIEPPVGLKIDCPTVFRYQNKWYMVYVLFKAAPKQGDCAI